MHHLDSFGMSDPDSHEGHPEDRCALCSRPVDEHPTWTHRRIAALALLTEWWDRTLTHCIAQLPRP